jgi:hypothetical protein
MNTLFDTTVPHQHQTVKVCSGYGDDTKRKMSFPAESLFSMAIYDMDSLGQQQQQQDMEPLPANMHVSISELLEISEDYLFGEAEENLFEEEDNIMINSTMLNPISLSKVPCGQNVASRDDIDYTEHVNSVHMLTMDHIEPSPINEWCVPMMKTSCQCPPKKRPREEPLDDEYGEALNHDGRFRPYQAGQWEERFNGLCLYRVKHGNCLVPHKYREDLPLASWVKRQRYQYKRMKEGKSSTMTEERVKALDEIVFVWDSHGAARGERLEELKEFRSIHMHCNVPGNFRENPQLAIWVKCQRTQYRLLMEGKASNMTPQRILDLEAVGFEWKLRSYKKQRSM